MLGLASRRLPGIRFESRAAQLPETLPRMDIAAFIGFAASGPLHVPVAVEDPAQFHAIFGDSLALAWDAQRGEIMRARLASAVNAFFANGGRRCWVVRVAGDDAAYNYFPLSGMTVLSPTGLWPAFARARSQGSWSDGLRVSAAIRLRAIQAHAGYAGSEYLWLAADSPRPTQGDLLRFTFRDDSMMFAVADLTSAPPMSPPSGAIDVRLTKLQWFVPFQPLSPPIGELDVEVRVYGKAQQQPPAAGDLRPTKEDQPHPFEQRIVGRINAALFADAGHEPGTLEIELPLPPAEAPTRGALIRLEVLGEEIWMIAERLGLGEDWSSPPQSVVKVTGRAWRRLAGVPAMLPPLTRIEIVTFDLRVQEAERGVYTLRDLGLAPGHPRYWNALAPDDAFFLREVAELEAKRLELGFELEQRGPSVAGRPLRFPLAGAEDTDAVFIPLGLTGGFDALLPPVQQPRSPLERDGLQTFDLRLFLDPNMIEPRVDQLMKQADFLRYLAPVPRPLKGIHAILGFRESPVIEEPTIIAVPDAVHPAWHPAKPLEPAEIEALPPIERPEWWPALSCERKQPLPRISEPDTSQFLDCDLRKIDPPTLEVPIKDEVTGTFTLRWWAREGDCFVLEEASAPDFADAHRIYAGSERERTLYSRSPGDYFYRVRVLVGRNTSDWSQILPVRVGANLGWEVSAAEPYRDDTLVAVHRALLRLCAGRGDLLAVLSLPAHYRERDAIAHAARLGTFAETETHPTDVRPLARSEARALSYGALYHPWLIGRQPDGTLDRMPPEGAVCGVFATRAARRGAWVAPANEPLRGILALTPSLQRERWQALSEAQVNIVRQEPRGFFALSEDTLTNMDIDPDLRPINVRRLLILLRRLALRRSAQYVFEPLSDAFRRQVQRGFEQTLFELFQRGAFAGKTPGTSYQVVTGPPVNTAQSLDQGRFFAEMRVAPSLPMVFLTVRLVHTGDRFIVTEGR